MSAVMSMFGIVVIILTALWAFSPRHRRSRRLAFLWSSLGTTYFTLTLVFSDHNSFGRALDVAVLLLNFSVALNNAGPAGVTCRLKGHVALTTLTRADGKTGLIVSDDPAWHEQVIEHERAEGSQLVGTECHRCGAVL